MSSKVVTPKKKKAAPPEGKKGGSTSTSTSTSNSGSTSSSRPAKKGGNNTTAAAPQRIHNGNSSAQQQQLQQKQKQRRADQAPRPPQPRPPSSSSSSATAAVKKASGSPGGSGGAPNRLSKQQLQQQQQQQQQKLQQQRLQQKQQQQKRRLMGPVGRRPKVLLHELAAQKYAAFLAEAPGRGHLPPLSYYRRPRRKRQRPDMTKALVALRVPQSGPVEGTHVHQFAPEWRKPMTVEPEQLGAFVKPGGGVIEPTLQPPPELKLAGIQGKDLNQGYLNYVEPDSTSSTAEITEMLDETPGLEREEETAHFITYRNNLNKILVSPYSKQKWEMEVFKEGGVIYLEVVNTDRNRGKMDRNSYWGRRFETLCVLGVEGARVDELQRGPDDPARPSYCALYRSRLGSHNLLMGAEIDACRPSDPGRFVEIKTTRIIRDAKDEQIFKKHKTLKYWAQCYLAGVRDLVVGYRDDHGIVREIKPWTTDGLVDAVDKHKHWDKDVCLNFTDRCLSFLKDNVDEGPRYSFKYLDPFDELVLELIGAQLDEAALGPTGPGSYAERL